MLSPAQEERGRRRLAFLLKQAEVFQHFAPVTAEKEKKKCGPSMPNPVLACSSAAAFSVEAGLVMCVHSWYYSLQACAAGRCGRNSSKQ